MYIRTGIINKPVVWCVLWCVRYPPTQSQKLAQQWPDKPSYWQLPSSFLSQ